MSGITFDATLFKPETYAPAEYEYDEVTTFLQDTFFKPEFTWKTDEVKVEYEVHKQRLAPFTQKGSNGVIIEPEEIGIRSFKIPEIQISMPFTPDQGEFKMVGEDKINSPMTPAQRVEARMRQYNTLMSKMIKRRKEKMCAELLCTGKITIEEKAENKDVVTTLATFKKDVKVDVDTKWTNPTAKIIDQIDKYTMDMRKYSGRTHIMLLGEEAYMPFINNEQILKMLDNRNVNLGSIDPKIISGTGALSGNGYSYIGRLNLPGSGVLEIFTYNAWYWDEKKKDYVSYIDPKTAIIAPRNLGAIHYGSKTLLDTTGVRFKTVATKEYTEVLPDKKSNSIMMTMYSKPIAVPSSNMVWKALGVVD